jgi:hypothetical protein
MKISLTLGLFLTSMLFTGCQQIERYMNWQHYKETAIREGLVPLHPEELYPENPERGYMFDSPVQAGRSIGSDERSRIQQAMQQAAQVQVKRIRAANNDHWCTETTEELLPPVPVSAEMHQLFERWRSAPEWLRLTFHNFDVVGTACTEDHFIFQDASGAELGVLEIHTLDTVCKPDGQEHFDDMRDKLYKALNIPY